MIISDLNHLEVVSEASSVVGGSVKHPPKKDKKDKEYNKLVKINVNVVKNTAIAIAKTKYGDAYAVASIGD